MLEIINGPSIAMYCRLLWRRRYSCLPSLGMTRTGELVYSWNSAFGSTIERNTVKRVYIQGLGGLKHPSFCRHHCRLCGEFE
ncbi:hypothetical protein HID58_057829 [Brassica napus]|uniref:Uncharacterized protein n=1 Tax=Brassica napus TaxID=3708 RepID=A0ABQ7XFB7_BRANA|nr:hypothetical protein HID58_057829 [Brassica napus]